MIFSVLLSKFFSSIFQAENFVQKYLNSIKTRAQLLLR